MLLYISSRSSERQLSVGLMVRKIREVTELLLVGIVVVVVIVALLLWF